MTVNDRFSRGHGSKKTRKLDAFIAAMMSHRTVEDAAAAVQISLSTAYRWMRDDNVVQRLAETRRDGMKATMLTGQS
jgi:hypothetical protein